MLLHCPSGQKKAQLIIRPQVNSAATVITTQKTHTMQVLIMCIFSTHKISDNNLLSDLAKVIMHINTNMFLDRSAYDTMVNLSRNDI